MPEVRFAYEHGAFEVEGASVRIGAGLREAALGPLLDGGHVRALEQGADSERFYELAGASRAGVPFNLYLRFRGGLLSQVTVETGRDDFWLIQAHRRDVALLRKLLPGRVKARGNRAVAMFPGGQAVAVFRTNVGALTEPGASFYFLFEAPEPARPRPRRSRPSERPA
jgi:hypothetical protein